MTTFRLLSYLSLLACAMSCAEAQDFQRIAPKPVEQVAPTRPVDGTPTPNTLSDNQVLVSKLKGLVFLPSPKQVATHGLNTTGIILKDLSVPEESDFKALTTPYLGQSLTKGKMNGLIRDVVIYYRQHDRPIVDVIVPQQDVTTGTVQVVVLEGKVGQVTTTGNRWFSSESIRGEITVQPGDEVRASQMQDDLDWVNANPFHSTTVVYHPGQKLGQTDLELQTHDRFPLRPYLGYEDSGNAATGFDRYEAGFNWGDDFGLGQQLNYQYTTSGNGESLRAHSGSYVVPLPWRNTLTFFGSYTETKGSIPPLFNLTGRSYQISGRYNIPLPTLTCEQAGLNYHHSFSTGFDYKYNKNSLEFGGTVVPGTLYDVDQFVLSYNGALTDPFGQTTINEQLYLSPGNWGGNNNDAAFNTAHAGATSDYVYNTLVLERLTRLPADFSLILRGTLQTSNANLAPSEQLSFGGYDTVRGYDEREVNTDEGYIFTTELRTPSVSLGDALHWGGFHDQLQFLGFWDYGVGSNHSLLTGEASEIPLSSLGFGVRYSINTYLTLRYDFGVQLLRTGLDNSHGNRSDLGIVVSY